MHHDHHLIEALRTNDPQGIRRIYDLYAPQAQRWVYSRNGSVDDARDVFQEALMVVYEKASDPAFQLTCPLGALLFVLYSRKWVDKIRQKNRESKVRIEEENRYTATVEADALTLAEEALQLQANQTRMASTFEQLSELCRQLLGLLAKGISPQETATQLQMNSVDTLYRRKNACTERWRAVYLES